MKNVPVCLQRPTEADQIFCSLMHANLCRWHHYCWKMDCLIKHIIWHICCLADQIEVVFCTNFFVKFVNVHVIFVLGHGKWCKFQACHAGPICSRFWGWTDFSAMFIPEYKIRWDFIHMQCIWSLPGYLLAEQHWDWLWLRSIIRILLETAQYF